MHSATHASTASRLHTSTNHRLIRSMEQAWSELLADALQAGFHGAVALEAVVQDGTIQHYRRRTESMHRPTNESHSMI